MPNQINLVCSFNTRIKSRYKILALNLSADVDGLFKKNPNNFIQGVFMLHIKQFINDPKSLY